MNKPESGVHVSEVIIYDLLLFDLPLAKISATITAATLANSKSIAFSHVYFWRLKFSLQMHNTRNRRRKPALENEVDLWRRFLERTCVMGLGVGSSKNSTGQFVSSRCMMTSVKFSILDS